MKKTKKAEVSEEGVVDEWDSQQYDPSSDMASVPIGTIAMVAATLSRPDMPADECVKKAYEILEITALGNAYLAGKAGVDFPTGSGVSKFLHHIFHQWDDYDLDAPDPYTHFVGQDEDGNPLPIPFERATKIIIPKAGKNSNRLPLFRQWLIDKYKLNLGEAGDRIAEWKKAGIPFGDFETAFYSYPKWRIWRTSKVRKEARSKRKARPQETSEIDKIFLDTLKEEAQERKKHH